MYFIRITIFCSLFLLSANVMSSNLDQRRDFATEKLKQFPELVYLLNPTKEFSPDKIFTPAPKTGTWSSLVNSNFSPEFEKTMTSLYNFKLLKDGNKSSYEEFTRYQDPGTKLHFNHFKKLARKVRFVRSRSHLIEANLIIRDMGKSPYVRSLVKSQCNIDQSDPQFFVNTALEVCPTFITTFNNLSEHDKELIKRINKYHFGHFAYFEGGTGMLPSIKDSKNLSDDLLNKIRNVSDILEVSATRGHVEPVGSVHFDEKTYLILSSAFETIDFLKNHTEEEALKFYLGLRKKYVGINENEPNSDILARIATLLKMVDISDGYILRTAFSKLSEGEKELVRAQLNPYKIRKGPTPSYIPAFLNNISYSLDKKGINYHESVDFVVKHGVVFVARVLESTENVYDTNQNFVLSFNKAAIQVSEAPDLPKIDQYRILTDGSVILINKN